MAWVEIMVPSARTLPTGKLTQNPIRTAERRCILYVGDDSGITPAWDHATHPSTNGLVVTRKLWGGNRTWRGAHAQRTLGSIIRTAHQRPQPARRDGLDAARP